MPYIAEESRNTGNHDKNSGELNYKITNVILEYLDKNGLSYQTCNDIVGALDNSKDEFRRRIQHPYEDLKIKENGDLPLYKKILKKLKQLGEK